MDLQGSKILGASEPQSSANIAGNSARVKKTEMCLSGSEWTLKAFQDFRGKRGALSSLEHIANSGVLTVSLKFRHGLWGVIL